MTSARRHLTRLGLPIAAAAIAAASIQCGLLGAPGDYTSGGGGDETGDASVETGATTDGMVAKDTAVVLPDGNVVQGSIGTITLMAGERQPTSPEDDPAWAADAWSGILSADGRVASWRIDPSAPIVGSFDSAGLIGSTWVMINVGFGLSGGRGTAIQTTGWSPGIAGDWKAARANGAPGGLDEYARVFAGNHLFYVGGVRTVVDPDGGATSSFLTREVHVATVDPAKPELGGATDPGAARGPALAFRRAPRGRKPLCRRRPRAGLGRPHRVGGAREGRCRVGRAAGVLQATRADEQRRRPQGLPAEPRSGQRLSLRGGRPHQRRERAERTSSSLR